MQELRSHLDFLYGKEEADRLLQDIIDYSHTFEPLEANTSNPYWYKYLNLYILYPDAFHHRGTTPLHRLEEHLDRVYELGCNALHILPFLESPLVDKGFDVSNYYKIRRELGSVLDIRSIIKKADEYGMKVFMDLVFNHVSDQHEWFQRAESGDVHYRDFFLHSEDKPTLVKKYHKGTEVVAEYLVDDESREVFIVFPEHVGEIPHWRQGKDGFWYYHTFYPQQLDVNWQNPHVFLEFAKILMFWAHLGFHFRLDAILYIGLAAYKDAGSDNPYVHRIISALRDISQLINPECAFIVESYETLTSVIKYFGSTNDTRAHLSYNFHLCTYLWIGIIKRDVTYIWQKMEQTNLKPKHAEWINFLRNHDELSLSHIPNALQEEVKQEIIPFGDTFREGHGVSGRTFSLLGGNEKRFLMSYFLLASLPGGLGIVYGDEYGKVNTPKKKLSRVEQLDSRNVNRGKLTQHGMESQKGNRIYENISLLLHRRSVLREYMNVFPEELDLSKNDKEVFAAVYTLGISKLYVFVNLSSRIKKIPIRITGGRIVLRMNQAHARTSLIELGSYGCLWIQV